MVSVSDLFEKIPDHIPARDEEYNGDERGYERYDCHRDSDG